MYNTLITTVSVIGFASVAEALLGSIAAPQKRQLLDRLSNFQIQCAVTNYTLSVSVLEQDFGEKFFTFLRGFSPSRSIEATIKVLF